VCRDDEKSGRVSCYAGAPIAVIRLTEAGTAMGEMGYDTADVTTSGGELPAYRVRRVAQYIQANLRQDLRLAQLSAVVHMSPYHFSRLFKRSTGVPPHRFLVRHRIEQACALLAARNVSIAEVARTVGFRTPSHFTTTFRRITGMTPSAYRSGGVQSSSR
jgi:AraC-like DNA-binding protein